MDAPRVDVAAIELSMEDVSGPVLAERLRRRCPSLRSLYLAKAGTPECEGVLVRPFSREDLVEKLIVSLPAAYLGILNSVSSIGTLNSTFSNFISATVAPLTICVIENGTMRPSMLR